MLVQQLTTSSADYDLLKRELQEQKAQQKELVNCLQEKQMQEYSPCEVHCAGQPEHTASELEGAIGAAAGSMTIDAQAVGEAEDGGVLKQQLAELQDWVSQLTGVLAQWKGTVAADSLEESKLSTDGPGRTSDPFAFPASSCETVETCNAAQPVLAGSWNPDSSAAGFQGQAKAPGWEIDAVHAAPAEAVRPPGCYRQLPSELQGMVGSIHQLMQDSQVREAALSRQLGTVLAVLSSQEEVAQVWAPACRLLMQ
eukprot:gene4699-4951_t